MLGISVAYPFVVLFALKERFSILFLGMFLALVVLLSFFYHRNKFLLGAGIVLCVLLFSCNNEIVLKFYPVLMNFGIWLMFASSLRNQPLLTKFAKKMGKDLSPCVISYTRHATLAWTIFMAVCTIVSAITVFCSDFIWGIYNGLISYCLIGMMMLVEYIVRKRVVRV